MKPSGIAADGLLVAAALITCRRTSKEVRAASTRQQSRHIHALRGRRI
jgi:transcription initiation factor TFIIIB Brf1 subunit/transcription initiation factor TFIIB